MYNINKHVYMYYIIEKQNKRNMIYLLNNKCYMVYKQKINSLFVYV